MISQITDFSIFKISDIGLLWSKITIFIIKISLKVYLQIKYGWNNPNSHRLGLKNPKFYFLLFLAVQKFIAQTNIKIHITGSIFIINWFFLYAHNNVLYHNQKQLKLPKTDNYWVNDPLKSGPPLMRGLDIHMNSPVSVTKLMLGLRVGFISSHLIVDKLFPINKESNHRSTEDKPPAWG